MAYRYLIYSTGTTYATTIVRESAINNPGVNEASLYTDFLIPEIQPLYLWRVTGGVNVVPNTDSNINNYETATAPPPQSNDAITYGEVTGITNTKIDKIVTGTTTNIPIISAGGNLIDSGYNIADILIAGSGVTNATFNLYTGTTAPNTYQTIANVSHYTGTTAPNTYYNKTQINSYTGQTQTIINSKLNTSVFTGYTASTKNKDKKIQVVSTIAGNVNLVTPTGITWTSAPFSADTYLWSATTANTVCIKSAGNYELQYHALLRNSAVNQTHSIGGYIVKNGSTVPITATAAMIVGTSASGELSLPPVVLTLANNDKLQLVLFRIGSAGTVNTVNDSTFMTINKLT